MHNKKDKSSDVSALPAPYISPWKTLKTDIKSIGFDIYLRVRQLIRINQEGDLLSIPFLPKYINMILLPLLLALALIITLLTSFKYHLHSTTLEKIDDQLIESSISHPLKQDSQNNYHQNTNYPFINKEGSYLSAWKMDVVLSSILKEDSFFSNYPDDLFVGSKIESLKNSILIQLGPKWQDLTITEKNSLAEHLLDVVYIKGYENLQLYDEMGHLLARNSRIGKEIILFEQV
ncbi:hypothetical protein [Prochlorococcus sp. MIT 1307]|uniref:hypothetical protein n=1 Tax=Prochlorococcus sp. MIT 1307 TaxID=3096219 RepID=UPI002A74B73E|nr:hypothetical protein [Prochlorococcus sp. MIT 1307]